MSHKIRVLNTRPQPRAASLTALLATEHIEVIEYSPILISAITNLENIQGAKDIAYNLDHFSDILITSGFAAEIGLDFLSNYWPQWPKIQWWSIGSATTQLMRCFSIDALCSPADQPESSESLLQALTQNTSNQARQNILIISGQEGRGYLQASLEKRDVPFSVLEVYQRTPNTQPPPLERFDAIILTSVDIAKGILINQQVLAEYGPDCNFICASERIANFVRSKGASKVINCRSANNETVSNHISKLLL